MRHSKLKATVMALAILALTATAASNAYAQQGLLTADGPVTLTGAQPGGVVGGPVTLTGTQVGAESANMLTALGGTFRCSSASYTGHKYNVTPHARVSSGATQVTVTPQYGKCTIFGKPATVNMNGCDYVFDLNGTTGSDKFGLKTTIVCAEGKDIQITIYDTEAKHTEGKGFCTLTITEKAEAYTGLSAVNTTNGVVTINGTVEGLSVDESSGTELCAEASTSAAKLHLSINLTATNAGGESRAISISDVGTFLWDETSSLDPNQWTTPLGAMGCNGSLYTGHKVLTHAETEEEKQHEFIPNGSTTFTVTPHYPAVCFAHLPILGTRPITVTMNGCDYVYHIGTTTSAEGTYGLTTDIVCPEGKQIETHMYKSGSTEHLAGDSICTIKIGSANNQGIGGIHLTATPGEGGFDLNGTLENIHTENSGSLCGSGTSETGGIDVDVTFDGHNAVAEPTEMLISE